MAGWEPARSAEPPNSSGRHRRAIRRSKLFWDAFGWRCFAFVLNALDVSLGFCREVGGQNHGHAALELCGQFRARLSITREDCRSRRFRRFWPFFFSVPLGVNVVPATSKAPCFPASASRVRAISSSPSRAPWADSLFALLLGEPNQSRFCQQISVGCSVLARGHLQWPHSGRSALWPSTSAMDLTSRKRQSAAGICR